MRPGEVVELEVQSDRRCMVLDLFEKAFVSRVNLRWFILSVRF